MEKNRHAPGSRLDRGYVPVFLGKDPVVPDREILDVKELLRPDEAADVLRVSRTTIFEMCAAGELDIVQVRKSTRIKTSSIRRILDGHENLHAK